MHIEKYKFRSSIQRFTFAFIVAIPEILLAIRFLRAVGTFSALFLCIPFTLIAPFFCFNFSKPVPILCFHIAALSLLSILYLYLARRLSLFPLFSLSVLPFLLNILIFIIFSFLFYVLTGNSRICYVFSFAGLLAVETANRLIYQFRAIEITPADLLSLRTAINVAGHYRLSLSAPMYEIIAVILAVTVILFLSIRVTENTLSRFLSLITLSILTLLFFLGLQNITPQFWDNLGTEYNGFPVNFLKICTQMTVKKPNGYSDSSLSLLQQQYTAEEPTQDSAPNIIVVMNESFSDLRVFGDDLYTRDSILPYWDALNENVIKGFALSSVYGGNTANSEWEFLTGNSMGFLPTGTIPYQTYMRNENNFNLVQNLKAQGYRCVAMHPFNSTGWNRPQVYPAFGFDEMYFIESFPNAETLRGLVSDNAVYQKIIQFYESKSPDEKIFTFAVTIQNHGNYNYSGSEFSNSVSLRDPVTNCYDVSQYLTIMQQSDAALDTLISYFSQISEETVILFFGDHQPALNRQYLETVHGAPMETLDQVQLKYMVPFFLWSNFDIQESQNEFTSLNFMSEYLIHVARLPFSGYNLFLEDVRREIPAMNSNGYYSKSAGRYLQYRESTGEEADILNKYQQLQYNKLFDKNPVAAMFTP